MVSMEINTRYYFRSDLHTFAQLQEVTRAKRQQVDIKRDNCNYCNKQWLHNSSHLALAEYFIGHMLGAKIKERTEKGNIMFCKFLGEFFFFVIMCKHTKMSDRDWINILISKEH